MWEMEHFVLEGSGMWGKVLGRGMVLVGICGKQGESGRRVVRSIRKQPC